MAPIPPGHPRHELNADADALDRVALVADYFAGLARNSGDTVNADRIAGEAHVLRSWEALIIEARLTIPPHTTT